MAVVDRAAELVAVVLRKGCFHTAAAKYMDFAALKKILKVVLDEALSVVAGIAVPALELQDTCKESHYLRVPWHSHTPEQKRCKGSPVKVAVEVEHHMDFG